MSPRSVLPILIALAALALACSSDDAPSPTPSPIPAAPTMAPSADFVTLTVLVAEIAEGIPRYDRDEWRHWTDADGDCQNARHETLIQESRAPVRFKDARRCQVASGEWVGPYTGELSTDAGELDVDHVVPLANAHRSGGWRWSSDKKERYANYLGYAGHLAATTRRANRAKSDKGPESWRPDNRAQWCQYALDWIEIKRAWALTATPDEAEALRDMVKSCDFEVLIQAKRVEPPSVNADDDSAPLAPTVIAAPTQLAPIATAAPTPTIAPTPAPAFEDRDCSDFDSWQEAQDFFLSKGGPDDDPHRLDRNRDGVACESLPGAP